MRAVVRDALLMHCDRVDAGLRADDAGYEDLVEAMREMAKALRTLTHELAGGDP